MKAKKKYQTGGASNVDISNNNKLKEMREMKATGDKEPKQAAKPVKKPQYGKKGSYKKVVVREL